MKCGYIPQQIFIFCKWPIETRLFCMQPESRKPILPHSDNITIADIAGPWVDPDWNSGLIIGCKRAWNIPLRDLSNEELATLLRQRIAVDYLLPIAKQRVENKVNDDTEMYDGELEAAIKYIGGSV